MALNIDELLGDKETVSEKKETVLSEETVSAPSEEKNSGISEQKNEVVPDKKTVSKKTAVKKKGKPRGKPTIGDAGLDLKEGDNARFMKVQVELFNMPDINMQDADAVRKRISDYFMLYSNYDMKPTVAGLGLALNGMDRRRLWEIKNGIKTSSTPELAPPVEDIIKKAYKMLENLWETYMNSGKMNPVSGIFLGKNNYGYQDKTEYVLTPNQNTDNDYDADSIRERYLETAPKRLTDGNDFSDEEQND